MISIDVEEQVQRLLALVQNVTDVHANVVMDTPKDVDLHKRAINAFQHAINVEKAVLEARLSAEIENPCACGDIPVHEAGTPGCETDRRMEEITKRHWNEQHPNNQI